MNINDLSPQKVLDFWFSIESKPYWFAKNAKFDELIRSQFGGMFNSSAARRVVYLA